MNRQFRDRSEAGRLLAERLSIYGGRDDVVVLALPRGGVPVGYEIARRLRVPLDVLLVRKLGLPGQEELAMGAIASGGVRVLNSEVVRLSGVPDEVIERVAAREERELNRRERAYRGDRPWPDISDKTVILVDDGVATGTTMRAAVDAVRALGPAQVVVAVGVAARESCATLLPMVDALVCELEPTEFFAVGLWYEEFTQLNDDDVRRLLEQSRQAGAAGRAEIAGPVTVSVGKATLEGDLVLPADVSGVVLFAHGSGSSRHSPRNRAVARALNARGLGTLLLDLLTAEEEALDRITREYRFDIALLAERLAGATDWLRGQATTQRLRIGYFGASTGAAAALVAAARKPGVVSAIVSRGGRPDLAGPALRQVQAPTLLIVGGADMPVIPLNQSALAELPGEKQLLLVPGATHLFEEPGALEEVARLAGDWFVQYLAPVPVA